MIDDPETAYYAEYWNLSKEEEDFINNIPVTAYHRMEMFWYEPETQEMLDDIFAGESEVSPLTTRLFLVLRMLGIISTEFNEKIIQEKIEKEGD